MNHTAFYNPLRADFFLRFVNVLSAFIRIADFDPAYPVWLGCKILLNSSGRTSSCYFQNSTEPHPLPRIGDVKRYLIRQRPHFIADFLIRSIIRTRLFNDYFGSLTNTPAIQRLLGCLTITAEQNASIHAKSTKSLRIIALQRGSLMCRNSQKA